MIFSVPNILAVAALTGVPAVLAWQRRHRITGLGLLWSGVLSLATVAASVALYLAFLGGGYAGLMALLLLLGVGAVAWFCTVHFLSSVLLLVLAWLMRTR